MKATDALGRTPNWKIQKGVLVAVAGGPPLATKDRFEDFDLHAEFLLPRGVNSGIYLRGCYEVQLIDDVQNKLKPLSKCGAIWGLIPPQADPSLGSGNTLDVRLVGRTVTVKINGTMVIDAVKITQPTQGAVNPREGVPGPIVLQNHPSDVRFRNIMITPLQ